MAKSLSGSNIRAGKTLRIGDNRYGMREAYDPAVDAATKEYYRQGDELKVIETKNSVKQTLEKNRQANLLRRSECT